MGNVTEARTLGSMYHEGGAGNVIGRAFLGESGLYEATAVNSDQDNTPRVSARLYGENGAWSEEYVLGTANFCRGDRFVPPSKLVEVMQNVVPINVDVESAWTLGSESVCGDCGAGGLGD